MTTLTAFYDLAVGPVSYDFIVFLVQAEIERRRTGADRMHVAVVPMAGGACRPKPQYDAAEAEWRLWNIVIPAPRLLGAGVSLALDWQHARRMASEKSWKCWPPDWDRQTLKDRRHLIGGVIRSAVAGAEIPTLSASSRARAEVRKRFAAKGRPVVTMTMRRTYLPERNSDPEAWFAARAHIEQRGYAVELIEDTSEALGKGRGFAELNLDLRMACYQEAALNLQANNGTASLCWFSDRPYVMFGAGVPAEEWRGLFVEQGLPLGENWPWARRGQRISYGREDADTITEAFEDWASATKSS